MPAKILSMLIGVLAAELAFFRFVDTPASICCACICALLYWRIKRELLSFVVLGALFASLQMLWLDQHRLAVEQNGQLFRVEGKVNRLLRVRDGAYSPVVFSLGDADVATYDGKKLELQNLRLSSYGRLEPGLHDWCVFYARLKSPVGTRNPGSINREMRYFVNRVSALGYVVEHPRNRCMANKAETSVARVRDAVTAALARSALTPSSLAVLRSLSIGDRNGLSDQQWSVFRHTGTAHLLAISGLHVGLVAALSFGFARSLLLLLGSRCGSVAIYRTALLFGLLAAWSYAALAGFSLPTQRAAIVVLVSTLALLRCRPVGSAQTLAWAAFAVVMLDCFAMLSLGFWMSFGAVSVLLMMRGRRPSESWVMSAFKTHCCLALASLPLVMLINDALPMSAPVANFIAVPVTCFAIVPLALAGVLFALFGSSWCVGFWQLAAGIWEYLWRFLLWLSDNSPQFMLPQALSALQIATMVVGIIALLIPLLPKRWLFVGACFGQMFFPVADSLKRDEWRLTVLDVGQGLSVIVETASRILIYDTGPGTGSFNAGQSILVPALRHFGHAQVDRIVISHADNDHAGGLTGLEDYVGTAQVELMSAEPAALRSRATPCEAGQRWQWDGVEFSMLAPAQNAVGSENDLSCVLKLESRYGAALLPGDIEAATEALLVKSRRASLSADILIAPHHGSVTSSTQAFVEAVDADFVVFAAGYENRFNFPHEKVRERYAARAAELFVTGYDGAIRFDVDSDGVRVRTARPQPLVRPSEGLRIRK